MEAQNKDYNMSVVRSVWRRMKKGHIKVRDLQPEKDVKRWWRCYGQFQTHHRGHRQYGPPQQALNGLSIALAA